MIRRTRVFRVLACLVVAMTGTAIFLSWIEPRGSSAAESLMPALAELQATQAIASQVPVVPGRWRSIQVVVCPESDSWRMNILAAVPPEPECHFVVGEDGRVETFPWWQEQLSVSEREDVVRVGVRCRSTESGLRYIQQVALRALLVELQRRCAYAGHTLDVEVEAFWPLGEVRASLVRSVRLALTGALAGE